jgi:hypothetical protein
LIGVHVIGAIEGIEHLPKERRSHLIEAKIPVYDFKDMTSFTLTPWMATLSVISASISPL